MTESVVIAPLTAEALDSVFQIEQEGGDTHWSRAHFEQELASPMSRFFVLKRDCNILGYGGYWKVGPEAQLVNLVVSSRERRQGKGQLLLSHLLERALAEGCRSVTLEVRGSNLAALALYGKAGFHSQGTRPNRYTDPVDDAILMEKTL